MMDARLAMMGAAILTLSGLIGLELTAGRARPDAAPIRRVPATPAESGIPTAAPPQQRDVRLNAILARPLFSPERRPAASGARSVSGLPRLTGIVVTETRKLAIFAAPGKPIVAEEGLHLGVYDVTAISDMGVTVVGPEGTTVLRPIFDPAPPPPAAKAVAFQRPEPPKATPK